MNLSVAVRHMDVNDAVKDYAEEKLSKLPKYFDGVQSAQATFDKDAGDFLVEIVVTAKRKHTFVATHRGEDLYACLDQCLHKIAEQLRRHKDRVRDRQGPPHEQTMAPPTSMTDEDVEPAEE